MSSFHQNSSQGQATPKPVGFEVRLEEIVGSVLAHPYRLYLGPLTLSLGLALWHAESAEHRLVVLGVAALSAVWYVPWIRSSWDNPVMGRTTVQGLFTLLGAALLGMLVYIEFFFVLLAVPFAPRWFLTYPLRWSLPAALLVILPTDFAFRAIQLNSPLAVGWLLLVRVIVVVLLGAIIRSFAVAAEQRRRLSDQLAVVERRAGTLEERQRFARDIHDTLAQGFAGIVVHLETATLERSRDALSAERHVTSAMEVARQSLEEARRMMGAMLPAPLDGRDLADAIIRVTNEWSERTGIVCEAVITGDAVPLDRDIEVALLRVVQEGLANVWKYAGAQQVTVTLSFVEDVVLLDVRDDGIGMPAAGALMDSESGATGMGIVGMRQRIERLNGTFGVESAAGEGTTVSVSVPAIVADTGTWVIPGAQQP